MEKPSDSVEQTGTRRDDLARLALGHFLERGFKGTSMSAIARDAQMTKAALYYHFASKEDLFVAAIAADTNEAIVELEAIAADSGPAAERFAQALALSHAAVTQGSMGRLLMVIAQVGAEFPEVARSFHDKVIDRFRTALRRIYADAQEAGTHRPLKPEDIEQIVFGPLLANAITEQLTGGDPALRAQNLDNRGREDFVAMVERLTRV
ncbi:MAG: TetR/AcrR family transcriptional regulator [Pseudomonadota bacterium]